MLHEGRLESQARANPFAWEGDEENILHCIEQLLENNPDYNWIGDIGMYYINYVDAILRKYPDTRFICMQRPEEEMVQSYLKWTPKKNHWIVHDGTTWQHDSRWDKAYPKFETTDKKDALHQYWTFYTQMTRELEDRLPGIVKVINLAEFNDQLCRESILDFIRYTGVRNSDSRVLENSYKHKKYAVGRKKIHNLFWSMKRKLVGSPGHRWFMKKRPV